MVPLSSTVIEKLSSDKFDGGQENLAATTGPNGRDKFERKLRWLGKNDSSHLADKISLRLMFTCFIITSGHLIVTVTSCFSIAN